MRRRPHAWPSWASKSSASTWTRRRSVDSRPGICPSTSRAWKSPPAQPRQRAAALHHLLRGGGRVRRRALPVRGHPAETGRVRRGRLLPGRRDRVAGPVSGPRVPDRRQVHGPGRHRSAPGRQAGQAGPHRRGRRAGMEPRVPARGLRREGHPAPRPDRAGRGLRQGREDHARGLRLAARGGHPDGHHRLPDRRAGQGRRQRVPRHQDLFHQRDGRGLRGGRTPTSSSCPWRSPTTTASVASSSTPASASAAAACPRTSAPSWPAPESSAPTRR